MKRFSSLMTILLLLIGNLSLAVAQPTGILGGTVLDKQTKQPLELVNVWIEGTMLGAATNAKGNFYALDREQVCSNEPC